jgi:hypothetical protein
VEARGVPRGVAVSFMRKKGHSKALFQEMDAPGSSGNPTAKAVAEAMEETNEFLRKTANRYGADIGRIPGYLSKQAHDADKMVKMGMDAWVQKIDGLLDHERTFGRPMTPEQRHKALGEIWSTIVHGKPSDMVLDINLKGQLDDVPGLSGPGNLGKKLSSRRTLHFKQDGNSSWEYMQAFGTRDVGSGFHGGITAMAKSIGAMRKLGPNPEAMFKELRVYARDEIKTKLPPEKRTAVLEKLDQTEKLSDALFEEVIGGAGMLPSTNSWRGKLARAANFSKNVSSSAILGGVTLTSFGDLGTAATRLADIGVNFFEAHGSTISSLTKGRRSGAAREIADSMGVGMDSLMAAVQARWLGNDVGDGQGAHLVSTVMRVTGMNWLNDTLKTSVGLTLGNYVAKQQGKAWGSINKQLRRELAASGITEADFKAITAATKDVEGKVYIDLDAIEDAGAAQRFREFVQTFADNAILTPGARTNAFIRGKIGDGQRGDPFTEIGTMFFHVKSFSIAYGTEILSRAYRKGEGVRLGYATHLLVSSLMYGYLASTLKDFAKGKKPRDPRDPAAWGDALLTSGGLGFYGDILMGYLKEDERQGLGPIEQAAGPVLGLFGRTIKIGKLLAEGNTDRAAQEGFRAVKSVLPGLNIFYARLALDYMVFWDMAEYIKPGFASKFERRVKEDTGQEFFEAVRPTTAVR